MLLIRITLLSLILYSSAVYGDRSFEQEKRAVEIDEHHAIVNHVKDMTITKKLIVDRVSEEMMAHFDSHATKRDNAMRSSLLNMTKSSLSAIYNVVLGFEDGRGDEASHSLKRDLSPSKKRVVVLIVDDLTVATNLEHPEPSTVDTELLQKVSEKHKDSLETLLGKLKKTKTTKDVARKKKSRKRSLDDVAASSSPSLTVRNLQMRRGFEEVVTQDYDGDIDTIVFYSAPQCKENPAQHVQSGLLGPPWREVLKAARAYEDLTHNARRLVLQCFPLELGGAHISSGVRNIVLQAALENAKAYELAREAVINAALQQQLSVDDLEMFEARGTGVMHSLASQINRVLHTPMLDLVAHWNPNTLYAPTRLTIQSMNGDVSMISMLGSLDVRHAQRAMLFIHRGIDNDPNSFSFFSWGTANSESLESIESAEQQAWAAHYARSHAVADAANSLDAPPLYSTLAYRPAGLVTHHYWLARALQTYREENVFGAADTNAVGAKPDDVWRHQAPHRALPLNENGRAVHDFDGPRLYWFSPFFEEWDHEIGDRGNDNAISFSERVQDRIDRDWVDQFMHKRVSPHAAFGEAKDTSKSTASVVVINAALAVLCTASDAPYDTLVESIGFGVWRPALRNDSLLAGAAPLSWLRRSMRVNGYLLVNDVIDQPFTYGRDNLNHFEKSIKSASQMEGSVFGRVREYVDGTFDPKEPNKGLPIDQTGFNTFVHEYGGPIDPKNSKEIELAAHIAEFSDGISVLVSSHDRRILLEHTLLAIAAEKVHRHIEVIVIDDAPDCEDFTKALWMVVTPNPLESALKFSEAHKHHPPHIPKLQEIVDQLEEVSKGALNYFVDAAHLLTALGNVRKMYAPRSKFNVDPRTHLHLRTLTYRCLARPATLGHKQNIGSYVARHDYVALWDENTLYDSDNFRVTPQFHELLKNAAAKFHEHEDQLATTDHQKQLDEFDQWLNVAHGENAGEHWKELVPDRKKKRGIEINDNANSNNNNNNNNNDADEGNRKRGRRKAYKARLQGGGRLEVQYRYMRANHLAMSALQWDVLITLDSRADDEKEMNWVQGVHISRFAGGEDDKGDFSSLGAHYGTLMFQRSLFSLKSCCRFPNTSMGQDETFVLTSMTATARRLGTYVSPIKSFADLSAERVSLFDRGRVKVTNSRAEQNADNEPDQSVVVSAGAVLQAAQDTDALEPTLHRGDEGGKKRDVLQDVGVPEWQRAHALKLKMLGDALQADRSEMLKNAPRGKAPPILLPKNTQLGPMFAVIPRSLVSWAFVRHRGAWQHTDTYTHTKAKIIPKPMWPQYIQEKVMLLVKTFAQHGVSLPKHGSKVILAFGGE